MTSLMDHDSLQQDLAFTWKKNLCMVWISQFICQVGFAFALPFTPFYFQQMGVQGRDVEFYVALCGSAPALAQMAAAPVWGYLADRFGRRKMLLRAYIGAALVLVLMGFCSNPVQFFILRILQGLLSGTVSAAQTLVATETPEEHSGFALGSLNSAVYSGVLAGSFTGGIFADFFGYSKAFATGGLFLLIPVVLVGFFVTEHFRKPEKKSSGSIFGGLIPRKRPFMITLPILILMGMVMFARQFDIPFVPLYVQKLHGNDSVATWTGLLSALCCAGSVLSGFLLGCLADRYPPGRLAVISSFATALFMFSLFFVQHLAWLFIGRFCMIFMSSGLEPALQIWLCRRTVSSSRGQIFGWAASFRALGWFGAPLAGGFFTIHFGIRSLYWAGPLFFLGILFFLLWVMRRFPEKKAEGKLSAS
ncbi:MAG: MFS transporter [Lentisphaeria bacterium]|nr:MFS transporter [Lentisphaeria bacterium]